MPPALGALGHQGDPMWGLGGGLSNMLHPIRGGGSGLLAAWRALRSLFNRFLTWRAKGHRERD